MPKTCLHEAWQSSTKRTWTRTVPRTDVFPLEECSLWAIYNGFPLRNFWNGSLTGAFLRRYVVGSVVLENFELLFSALANNAVAGHPLVCVTNNFFNWHTKPSNFSVEFTNFEFTRPAEFLGRHCFARAFGRKRRGCALGRSFRVISGCFPQKHMQANKPQASWGKPQIPVSFFCLVTAKSALVLVVSLFF